jgi:hypothetical protein
VLPLRPQDLESLEAITQDDGTRDVVLRMAQLSSRGSLVPFLVELGCDQELDAATKATCAELASDVWFLHVVEDYIHRTHLLH